MTTLDDLTARAEAAIADARIQLRRLHDLADKGNEIAAAAHRQAHEGDTLSDDVQRQVETSHKLLDRTTLATGSTLPQKQPITRKPW